MPDGMFCPTSGHGGIEYDADRSQINKYTDTCSGSDGLLGRILYCYWE